MRRPPGLRGGWDLTQPADLGLLTRPAEPWPATRPHEGWQHTRPMDEGLHTRPADLPAARTPTRPAARSAAGNAATTATATATATAAAAATTAAARATASATAPGTASATASTAPAAAPAAAAPAPVLRRAPPAAITTPPSATGHWQVAGEPGQHIVLMPGQMHIGAHAGSVRTLLGSCVAITLWHPARRIGGMCHFLLPSRSRRAGEPADGRYGDEAVASMVASLKALRAAPEGCVAHLYGGADTMSGVSTARFNIGERNIEQGWTLIDRYGFRLDGVDVGEDIPRMVSLSLGNGTVAMRRGTGSAPDHLRS